MHCDRYGSRRVKIDIQRVLLKLIAHVIVKPSIQRPVIFVWFEFNVRNSTNYGSKVHKVSQCWSGDDRIQRTTQHLSRSDDELTNKTSRKCWTSHRINRVAGRTEGGHLTPCHRAVIVTGHSRQPAVIARQQDLQWERSAIAYKLLLVIAPMAMTTPHLSYHQQWNTTHFTENQDSRTNDVTMAKALSSVVVIDN